MMEEGASREHYVYMLLARGGRLYTGYTTDPVRRYGEHKSGGRFAARFTRAFTPVSIAFCLKVDCSRSDIMKVEAAIKKLSREEKLRIIAGETDVRPLVTACCGRTPPVSRVHVEEIEKAVEAAVMERKPK